MAIRRGYKEITIRLALLVAMVADLLGCSPGTSAAATLLRGGCGDAYGTYANTTASTLATTLGCSAYFMCGCKGTGVEEEIEVHWQSYCRSHDTCNSEYAKWERYCREPRGLRRELEDLKAGERRMYELNDRKDQVMTVLTVALANLAMWVRDNHFPPEYARATWNRLAPFFRLPGLVVRRGETLDVELRSFDDRHINRDLAEVSVLIAGAGPRLPDGRRVLLAPAGGLSPVARPLERRIA